MDYKEKLKDKRWIGLKENVLNYYNHTCNGCGNNVALHVHHKRYFSGREPWEYELKYLTVLCDDCHNKFHINSNILKELLINNRLFYSYEFDYIIKIIERITMLSTSDYNKILDFLDTFEIPEF